MDDCGFTLRPQVLPVLIVLFYTLYQTALSVIGKNEEFREIYAYYTTRKNNPLKKIQSVVAVACKMIRIFYKILTTGVSYDGTRYERPLKMRYQTSKMQIQKEKRQSMSR